MKLLLDCPWLPDSIEEQVRRVVPDAMVMPAAAGDAGFAAAWADAEVYLGWPMGSDHAAAKHLRWVQTSSAWRRQARPRGAGGLARDDRRRRLWHPHRGARAGHDPALHPGPRPRGPGAAGQDAGGAGITRWPPRNSAASGCRSWASATSAGAWRRGRPRARHGSRRRPPSRRPAAAGGRESRSRWTHWIACCPRPTWWWRRCRAPSTPAACSNCAVAGPAPPGGRPRATSAAAA